MSLACGSSAGNGAASRDGGNGEASDGGGLGASDAAPGSDGGPPDDGGPTADSGLIAIPLLACDPVVYAAEITIGGSQTFQLVLDTGSTTLAVAAAGCSSCTDAGVSALYEPGPTAVDQKATATATYGALAPSGWSGEIYEDTVGGGAASDLARVKLVAIAQQSQFLVGTCGSAGLPPQGVIGFAPSLDAIAGTNGFFDQVVASGVVPNLFATRLCPTGGTLWLGGYDPTFTAGAPVYTPMTPPGFDAYVYTVSLASIGVLGTTIPIPTGSYTASLLDTGSSISSLSPAAYSALTSAIAASSAFTEIFGASSSSFFSSSANCVQLSQTKEALDSALPPLTLNFGSSPGVSVQASATESYLLSLGGKWCPAMTSRTPDASFQSIAAILGAPILASNVVIFDRANQRVGFAPHTACP
jgi:hypothetical protein